MKTKKAAKGGMLIIITGFSASGKDTLMQKLLDTQRDFQRIITFASRKPREGEIHGKDYHFVQKEEFEGMIKKEELFEYVDYAGDYKGTHKNSITDVLKGKNLIWRIDMSRAAIIRETMTQRLGKKLAGKILERLLVVVVGVKDQKVLLERARKREPLSFDEDNFRKRLQSDMDVLNKYSFENIIYNDSTIEAAYNQLVKVVKGFARKFI